MAEGFPTVQLALVAVLICAVGLAACGRKGPLDLPPSSLATPAAPAGSTSAAPAGSVTPTAQVLPGQYPPGTTQPDPSKAGFDANGNPVAPPGPKRDFFLDFLLR